MAKINKDNEIYKKIIIIKEDFKKNKNVTDEDIKNSKYRRVSVGKLSGIKGLLANSPLTFKVGRNGKILDVNDNTHHYTINIGVELEKYTYSRLKNFKPFITYMERKAKAKKNQQRKLNNE